MNRNQLVVLWVGIAIFALIGLNPRYSRNRPVRWSREPSTERYRPKLLWGPTSMEKLVAAWGITTVVTGGLIYSLRRKKNGERKSKEKAETNEQ